MTNLQKSAEARIIQTLGKDVPTRLFMFLRLALLPLHSRAPGVRVGYAAEGKVPARLATLLCPRTGAVRGAKPARLLKGSFAPRLVFE